MAAPAITHQFVSAIADGADATVVRPSNWNATHSLANFTAASKLLGAGSAAATPDEITIGSGLSMTGSTLSATASATPALSALSAATGANTIASGNNTGQVWNWANTADSTIAFTFGETSAATGGTSTSGIPNQVLAKFITVAASTQSPLSVYSRGTHVFSVSPSAAQILGNSGAVGNPTYSFTGFTNAGIYYSSGVKVAVAGAQVAGFTPTGIFSLAGSAASPSFSNSVGTEGLFTVASTSVGIAVNSLENSRFIVGGFQPSQGSADAVAYTINSRKSRGTVAAPTVITTGDDLLTIKGFGYLGATNTYEEACRITFDSIGTISDSTSGIGGVIRFNTANQGTVGVVEAMSVWNTGDVTIGLPTPATSATKGFPQIPTMSGAPNGTPTVITGFNPMVYDTTNTKLWVYDYGAAAWKGVALA